MILHIRGGGFIEDLYSSGALKMSRSYNKRFLTIKCLFPIGGGGVSHNMTFMEGDLPAILPATSDLPASRKFLCQVLPQVDNLDIWQTSSSSYLAIYIYPLPII